MHPHSCRPFAVAFALALAGPLAGSAVVHADAHFKCDTVSSCKAGCDRGEVNGCVTLAGAYERGDGGLTKDPARALALLLDLCEKTPKKAEPKDQHIYVCDRVATMLYDRKDYTRAAAVYQRACNAGLGRACAELAYMYKKGDGVKLDLKAAMPLYVKGHKMADAWCTAGDPAACFFMANEHDLAIGELKKDEKKGADYFEKACNLDGEWGCEQLAAKYERGEGVKIDAAKAKQLYQRACDAGESSACDKAKGAKQ